MASFLKIALPAYFAAYVIFIFVLPSLKVKKRINKSPYMFGKSESAHDYMRKITAAAVSLLLLNIFLFSFIPEFYFYLNPFEYLELEGLTYAGLFLLAASFVLILTAQKQMHNSWRMGIDNNVKTELIDKGVFRYSRNPVFLGTFITMLGFFLILPNAASLLTLALTYFFIQVQTRMEEEYLRNMHGENYTAYCGRVRRWL
jgi:protein-S-isoprenylcysteine O-methyltransferase Ste14